MSTFNLSKKDLFVPITIDENDLFDGVRKLLRVIRPTWSTDEIKFKVFTDGITNKLVGCQLNTSTNNEEDIVLVRIYGNKTDLLIDRKAEIRNIKTLNVKGMAPQVYGVFENGLAYQYYPGNTLNVDSVLDPKVWPLVAQQMAKMHKVELGKEVLKEPFVWDKIEQFLNLLPEPFSTTSKQNRFVNSFGSITKLRIDFERLKSHLTKTESPIVFAHNDLLLGNVIYNKDEERISFIDYEYATYNYQAYDIANHFNEFVGLSIESIDYNRYPSREFQLSWIKVYLMEFLNGAQVSENYIEKIYKEVEELSLASHFLWGVWSLVQFEHSDIDFDFGRYAEIRLNRYYDLLDKVITELS
ncbi:hypothetical protein K1T71_005012 [Dendrolimus kikuchii]|uniref:Uncharacterized protein n=1 Tax=Dendrolimus kikuchii TaxID=765133 RepID=A0ACC1D664_9NEOP|nr:hypothetical protein K1T71_005012 [Dendrolimus kikuchii]